MNGCLSWLFHWMLPEGISYDNAKLRVQTFDLVYFCQLGTWTGPFVAAFGGRWATHMGLLIRGRPDIPGDTELYVLEAVRHGDDARDVSRSDDIHTGVRVVSLREKLQRPQDRYFVYVQSVFMPTDVRAQAEAKLWPLIYKFNTTPYEQHMSEFAVAPIHRTIALTKEDLSSLFCSEIVALALRTCGLLDVKNVALVWHTHFLSGELHLSHGARLDMRGYYIKMIMPSFTRPLTVIETDARLSWRSPMERAAVQALPAVPAMVMPTPVQSRPPPEETAEEMAKRISKAGSFKLPD